MYNISKMRSTSHRPMHLGFVASPFCIKERDPTLAIPLQEQIFPCWVPQQEFHNIPPGPVESLLANTMLHMVTNDKLWTCGSIFGIMCSNNLQWITHVLYLIHRCRNPFAAKRPSMIRCPMHRKLLFLPVSWQNNATEASKSLSQNNLSKHVVRSARSTGQC